MSAYMNVECMLWSYYSAMTLDLYKELLSQKIIPLARFVFSYVYTKFERFLYYNGHICNGHLRLENAHRLHKRRMHYASFLFLSLETQIAASSRNNIKNGWFFIRIRACYYTLTSSSEMSLKYSYGNFNSIRGIPNVPQMTLPTSEPYVAWFPGSTTQ
jgi:hypothetical protein